MNILALKDIPIIRYQDRKNQIVYNKYVSAASATRNVIFLGRLAQYQYYNMDQVVQAALNAMDAFLSQA